MMLIDIETEQRQIGSSHVFTYMPIALMPVVDLLRGMSTMLTGRALGPAEISVTLDHRFRLLGVQLLVGIAISSVDMTAWDAVANARNLPLSVALGGMCKPVPALGIDGLVQALCGVKKW
jgi:mandelate racemase